MRQFVSETALDGDGCIRVGGEKFHYLSAVLRLVPGDMLYVRLPDGALQQMTVAQLDGSSRTMLLSLAGEAASAESATAAAAAGTKGGTVSADSAAGGGSPSAKATPIERAGRFHFHLFQFVPKPPKLDLIIRQAAECGVSTIQPVAGEFCQKGNVESAVKKSSPSDMRWGKIITEAREQSGSPVPTRILPCRTFAEACALWKNGSIGDSPVRMAFVLYERSGGTLPVHRAIARAVAAAIARAAETGESEGARAVGSETAVGESAGVAGESAETARIPRPQTHGSLKNAPETADIAVMVGAEGGISPSELAGAKESGFIPVHLETNILRCETAALYGLAALQNAVVESDIWKLKE